MNVLLLKAWLAEQGPALIGGRLRRARQHDQRSLVLELLCDNGPYELLFSVLEEFPVLALLERMGASNELTHETRSPESELESNFCKALNFHLAGYRLASIAQEGFDRSVLFTFTQTDIYGRESLKVLRHELVGRASNAYLLTEAGLVVSIFKRVRREQNRVRHILTGKPLPEPPPLGKFSAAGADADALAAELAEAGGSEADNRELGDLERFFVERVAGCDHRLWPALEPLLPVEHDIETLYQFIDSLQRGELTAQLFDLRGENAANRMALELWRQACRKRGLKAQGTDPLRERIAAKLDQLLEQRRLAERADELERLAMEMLQGAEAQDAARQGVQFLADWQKRYPEWAAQLVAERSVYDNAQELLHYAQRLRRGTDKLERLIAQAEEQLERAEQRPGGRPSLAAVDYGQGRPRSKAPGPSVLARLDKLGVKHSRYISSDGMDIVCGQDAKSNDEMLRALGGARHLWLHARDYPGCHVIVLSGGREVPRRTLEEAAVIAAYNSQGRKEGTLDVSYLPLTQVRRPRDGKPGQVLKMREKVINVDPARYEELKDKLRQTL